MKLKISLILAIVGFSLNCFASTEFCQGFEIGYKTIKGNNVLVPICPIPPITPIASTPYQEGIKAGIHAARTR